MAEERFITIKVKTRKVWYYQIGILWVKLIVLYYKLFKIPIDKLGRDNILSFMMGMYKIKVGNRKWQRASYNSVVERWGA
jgi:hypothetical protein